MGDPAAFLVLALILAVALMIEVVDGA